MRPPITHNLKNRANALVLDGAALAYKVALALADSGFTLLAVEIGGTRARPVIWIQGGPLCHTLGGVTHVRRQVDGARERVMVATNRDRVPSNVQVQWVEPDTAWRRAATGLH